MKTVVSQFTWNRTNPGGEGTLVTEASCLGIPPGAGYPRVLEISSPKTGVTRTFKLAGRLICGEEVAGATYWDDELPKINVQILND